MRNLIHNLKAVDGRIHEVLAEIKVLEFLPFFKIFNRNESKEIEIHCLRSSLRDYYSAKFSILENMEAEIRKEKIKLTRLMRENTLKKAR